MAPLEKVCGILLILYNRQCLAFSLMLKALKENIVHEKPLVCADFRPHPHAHRTHFRSVRRTHTHPHIFSKKNQKKILAIT